MRFGNNNQNNQAGVFSTPATYTHTRDIMLVVKIDFDSVSQLLSTIILDQNSGELVHLANYKFESGKEVVYRTLWSDESFEPQLKYCVEKFGRIETRAHLFINLLRGLINSYEGDIYDTREAIDWLIEEQDFSMKLTMEDLEAGLSTVQSTMGVLGTAIGANSEWTIRHANSNAIENQSIGCGFPLGYPSSERVH